MDELMVMLHHTTPDRAAAASDEQLPLPRLRLLPRTEQDIDAEIQRLMQLKQAVQSGQAGAAAQAAAQVSLQAMRLSLSCASGDTAGAPAYQQQPAAAPAPAAQCMSPMQPRQQPAQLLSPCSSGHLPVLSPGRCNAFVASR